MKVLYTVAWVFLAAAVVFALVTGSFNPSAIVMFSLVALGLVYTLALWAVSVNAQKGES